MFDPFDDFDTAGYLRNKLNEKNISIVKRIEHDLFEANLENAILSLSSAEEITYNDFLEVHHILFSEFYPWAGQDRSITAPDIGVSKGETLFALPQDARFAVIEGLRLGQINEKMNQKPGEIMGLFAYGHPFLDGNGRTMLVVHSELCYRSGFSINWRATTKNDYLYALSSEIEKPDKGILDEYLLQFIAARLDMKDLSRSLLSIKGLDGLDADNKVEGELNDRNIEKKYHEFDKQRNYKIIEE